MKIQFCGAAQEVTGSSHLLMLNDGTKILLDCGLYQGENPLLAEFNRTWKYFDPADIDCLVLSHAHIDHVGRVPKLVRDGFRGAVVCTHATKSLAEIMLLDSAKIQESEREYPPLYTVEDAKMSLEKFIGFDYDSWIPLSDSVKVLFRDAGHLLGSANVSLEIEEAGRVVKLGFSGDVGRYSRPLLRNPQPMPPADYVLCEATYGGQYHNEAPEDLDKLCQIVHETCVERSGKLLIPAFSVGRTQEIVYMLNKLSNEGRLPAIPIYIDSPLSVNATEVFRKHLECFDGELQAYLEHDADPFGFSGLHYVREVEESKKLNSLAGPCIIIASDGMANVGRIRHHLANNLDNPSTGVLIVGYCSPNSGGGQLRAGVKTMHLFRKTVPVHARVYVMDSFSAHADEGELLRFLANQLPFVKKIFLVHGEIDRQQLLQKKIATQCTGEVLIPALGEVHTLS